MKPSVALEANRRTVRQAVQRFKTANPRVFGAVLRGENRDGSKLDIAYVEAALDAYLPGWQDLDAVCQRVLANRCFNLGIGKLLSSYAGVSSARAI